MLSGLLNSDRAIRVNIAIMRAFVQLRKFLETNKELALKIEALDRTVSGHDESIHLIFETIRELMEKRMTPENQLGIKSFPGRNSNPPPGGLPHPSPPPWGGLGWGKNFSTTPTPFTFFPD